jgi:aspartate/tyrosine/aromatic aminotransferase
MIKLIGIAKGLNNKINEQPTQMQGPQGSDVDVLPDTELAQEYADDLSKVIEQLETLEEEMAREFDNIAVSTQDVSYNQQSNQMSRYISQASKNIERLIDMLERYS